MGVDETIVRIECSMETDARVVQKFQTLQGIVFVLYTNSLPGLRAKTKTNKPLAYLSRMLLECCSSSSWLQLVFARTEINLILIYLIENF